MNGGPCDRKKTLEERRGGQRMTRGVGGTLHDISAI